MKPTVKIRLVGLDFFEQGLKRTMHLDLDSHTRKGIRKYDEELCERVLEDTVSVFDNMIVDATDEGILKVQNILVDKFKKVAEDLKSVFPDKTVKITEVNNDLFNNTLYVSFTADLYLEGQADSVYSQYALLADVDYGVSTNGYNFIPTQASIVGTKTVKAEKTNFQSVQYLEEDVQPVLGY